MSLEPGTPELAPTLVDPPRVPARIETVRRQFDGRVERFRAHDAVVREVGRRLIERLDDLKLAPQRIADIGCGSGGARDALLARYPGSTWIGVDLSLPMLRAVAPSGGRIARWLRPPRALRVCADAGALPLADATVDLVFSNLMLHWHPAPHSVFAECKRVLRGDGLLMFSCFGPDTGKQLRAACAAALPDARPFPFVDMHDYGDMLVAAGFAAPVMDVDVLTLTFDSPRALLREVAALGGNPRDDRRASLVSTRQAHALIGALEAQRDAAGRISLTFEVAYGHARKPQPRTASATSIPVDRLRADLAARRRRPDRGPEL
ncbi:MAG: methyltransferase domain-containing protein [Burkholderiaceae bacterium]